MSIVIPCYNHEKYVQEAIKSVINQDYDNIELIIIDDGSSDDSTVKIKEIIPACQQRFKRFEFRHRPNKGLCATLNEALEWCEGEFFASIASDDVLRKYKTSRQVKYLQENASSIGVFGSVEIIHDANGTKQTKVKRVKKYNFKDIFLHQHNLSAPTQLLQLKAVKSVGGYREDLIIEDWSMWLFLTEHGGTLDCVDTVFASYRRHDGNLSSQFEKMQNGRKQVVALFSGNDFYKKALARTYMVAAHDCQKIDFKKSFQFIKSAINLDLSIIFSLTCLRYASKYVMFWR